MNASPHPPIELADIGPYVVASQHRPQLSWDYAIKGLMRRGEVSMLHGQSNTGKTALLSFAAARIASGRDFLGHRTGRGIVIHIAAEAPESVLDRYHAHDFGDLAEPPEEYIVRQQGIDLGNPADVEMLLVELRALAQRFGAEIVLIVIDTLVLCIGGRNENDSAEMAEVTRGANRLAREMNAHVCLVHHDVKNGQGYRGSSVFRANVDTEFALSVGEAGVVTLSSEKQRTMPRGPSVHFRLEEYQLGVDEDDEKRTTVRVVPTATPALNRKGKERDAGGARMIALRTALMLLGMSHDKETYRFRPADLVSTLPPELFGEISDESKAKAILRLLTQLENTSRAPIARDESGWRLIA